jgi:hypothetical protein
MERNMKKIIYLFICLFAGTVNAGLVGDTVHIAHYWSDVGSEIFTPMDVLVEDGTADVADVTPYYSVDVDDLSVFVDFSNSATWANGTFNGLVISNIDTFLTDFVVSTNMVNWVDSKFTYSNDSLMFNWNKLSVTNNTTFRLDFNVGNNSQVPEPTTLALIGLGLAGIGFSRKKKTA